MRPVREGEKKPMAEKDRMARMCAAAPAAATATSWPVENRRREDQLELVDFLTRDRDSHPNAAMRELAEEYRRDVAEGRIKSS
jgi:hypothetical protein